MTPVVHSRTRKLIGYLVGLMMMAPLAHAQEIATAARFDVRAFGVKAGTLTIAGSTTQSAYTSSASFVATGLIGGVSNIRFQMRARGTRARGRFAPSNYTEDMTIGRRSSNVELSYVDGVPTVTGGKLGLDDATPADPTKQGGTLDPLTPMFAVMRDQPRSELCQLDQILYDGARRTSIKIVKQTDTPGRVTCTGRFERLEGYSKRQLRRTRFVDINLTYEPRGDIMALTQAQVSSRQGVVELTRH